MAEEDIVLPPSAFGSNAAVVNVRPLVPFSILDHHIRRDANQDRVIGASLLACTCAARRTSLTPLSSAGALLGNVVGGIVDVTDAFGVYHTKRGEEEVRSAARLCLKLLCL